MRRLLLPVGPQPPSRVRVDGRKFHYLVRVLRMREKDILEVFDGEGSIYPAWVERISEDNAELALGPPRHEPPLVPITLIQGLPKGDKLDWVLEKGTELGATAFMPVDTERAVVKLDKDKADSRLQRWQRIVDEAARQCGRADVPVVSPLCSLIDAVRSLPPEAELLALDEEERSMGLSTAASAVLDGRPLALVVGPEGGLSRPELTRLVALGATAVTLGRRVLRTETAALAALAVVRHLEGQLG